MQYSSFEKGEQFEKFVEDELFKSSQYDLIHRTNNFVQNATRFAEDTLKPDFKFRCKQTQQEFYVEAKYRSGFNRDDKIEVISHGQIERFKVIQKEENTLIYIAVGYGGQPNDPDYVSLIPLNELAHLELYSSFLSKFHIHKEIVDSSELNFTKYLHQTEASLASDAGEQNAKVEQVVPLQAKRKHIAIASTIGLFLFAFLIFNVFKTSIDDTLKQRTEGYYNTIDSGNIDALENYISPNVHKWYKQSNLTFTEIKKQTKAYMDRHPHRSTEIQWDSFKVAPLNDDYAVSYNMIYKLLKENNGKDRVYHLKIHAVWNSDLKLKSLYEERL